MIPVQPLQSLTAAEINSELEQKKRQEFNNAILKLYGDYKSVPPTWIRRRRKDDDQEQYVDESEDSIDPSFGDEQVMGQATHVMSDIDTVPDFEAYVHAEVMLPNDEGIL